MVFNSAPFQFFVDLPDKLASAGYYAVVSDFFFADPFIPKTQLQEWLKNHEPKLAVEFAKPLIHALQEKGISKIGAAGFCWGAKVVVELAKDADIQVAALLHPTSVTLDDIKGVKVPVAILGAEFDKISPPELVKQFEAAMQAKSEYLDHARGCAYWFIINIHHQEDDWISFDFNSNFRQEAAIGVFFGDRSSKRVIESGCVIPIKARGDDWILSLSNTRSKNITRVFPFLEQAQT
ncbi:hypothetical protein E3N88_40948 [Mikania micrantha]|uniref:Dienelactone hydrolase domain-containing protein n=1 Tax=Mikania micrantha TaxID=192012 RepID=A0A5N6LQ14_9ASTR|nr:hypothetical protein E3N88_40948 [Mikania micrantha]